MDFWTKLLKKGPKQESDHHHQILHIQNGLGIKLQQKLKTEFLDKLTQKKCFQSKKEKKGKSLLNSTYSN